MHKVLVNRLGISLPRKNVVRLTDHLDMTIGYDRDIKPQNKQTVQTHSTLCSATVAFYSELPPPGSA